MKGPAVILGVMLLLAMGLSVLAAGEEQKFNPDEVKAVKQACLDYVEGYFDSDGNRIAQGVHPSLVKRTIKGNTILEMTREQLIGVAVAKKRAKPPITVEVYDIYNGLAVAKITSGFVDYVQVAKFEDKWQVVNVLWGNFVK